MPRLTENGLAFVFPDGWRVEKYDGLSFYRNQFQSFAGGSKAVDFVALSPTNGEMWLIEVKDYRQHQRSKTGSVFHEVAEKVRSTLAGLATARVRASDAEERALADSALRCTRIRVALHLDQPRKPSRLRPDLLDPALCAQQMRRAMKAVDPHAVCYGQGVAFAPQLPWTVEKIDV